jgi:hypothetical protein
MSKDLFNDLRETYIYATIDEERFMEIPSALREEMTIKRIDQFNFRPLYEQDSEWKKRQEAVKKALQARSEREDEIRANFKTDK